MPGEKKPGPSMASHGFFSHACLSCDVPAPTTLSPHPPTLERLWPTPLDPCSRLRAARGLKYRQGRSWTSPPCTTVLWYIPLLHRLGSPRVRNEPHTGRGASCMYLFRSQGRVPCRVPEIVAGHHRHPMSLSRPHAVGHSLVHTQFVTAAMAACSQDQRSIHA